MTDDLRLRTARALGWEPAWQREEEGLLKEGWRYKDWRRAGRPAGVRVDEGRSG